MSCLWGEDCNLTQSFKHEYITFLCLTKFAPWSCKQKQTTFSLNFEIFSIHAESLEFPETLQPTTYQTLSFCRNAWHL